MAPHLCHFIGLDLGQAQDPTALAVLERPRVYAGTRRDERRPTYALRHLHRFPLGTPYAEVFDEARRLLRMPPLPGAFFAVDQTGVGRAVLRMLEDQLRDQVTCLFCAITITVGGTVATAAGGGILVPRKELVGTLRILLQARRLLIPRTLPLAETLVRELQDFRAKVPAAGGAADSVEAWREGPHDDLVLALALAAWCGERGLPPLHDPPPPRPNRLVSR